MVGLWLLIGFVVVMVACVVILEMPAWPFEERLHHYKTMNVLFQCSCTQYRRLYHFWGNPDFRCECGETPVAFVPVMDEHRWMKHEFPKLSLRERHRLLKTKRVIEKREDELKSYLEWKNR